MAPKSSRKGVSYYFRLELNTLQGKITSGFCFLGVLASIMMCIASWIIYPALGRSQYIVEVLDASDHQLLQLSATTEHIVAQANAKVAGAAYFSANELALTTKILRTPLDSLSILSRQWNSKEAILSLKLLEAKAESMVKAVRELGASSTSSERQEQLAQQELVSLKKVIQEQVKTIQKTHTLEKKEILGYIKYRTENLGWILLCCLGMSILIGGTYATYIVMRVLKEIHMLKSKILEISEGKLIETIPPSKNELNSIIKALNILSENLRNIRHFAQEVGKGNFNTNISVFEGQNDLGEALAGMRDSLKTVAQEEKQRNWVATGLAQFSELLRVSTNDLGSYYQSIVSELVKHLKVNQAALYILEQPDGGEAVLELKASYAFDRLKYQQKSLAPGQGLAGQVFLEKKPLFINNIPKTFMQISSGLGAASPRYLAVVPLKVNETVNGVLELASFHPLAPFEVEFLMKIAENISGALQNVSNAQTTARLLEEAQGMAQAMQAQEEMLRQNTEELIATQEQLNCDLQETTHKAALLEQSLLHSPVAQLIVSQQGIILEANRKAMELFSTQQLQNCHLSALLQAPELMDQLQQTQRNKKLSIELDHPGIGKLHLQLQAFAAGEYQYFNLLLMPQESFFAV